MVITNHPDPKVNYNDDDDLCGNENAPASFLGRVPGASGDRHARVCLLRASRVQLKSAAASLALPLRPGSLLIEVQSGQNWVRVGALSSFMS